ncbi:MAG: heme exporter protein CcmD [Acidobacteria bacterium]|nr:heme exporter protein CcmD [Acidobacteriota bacterium]
MSFMEFLDMGGYAGFVWPAYLITAAVLIVNLLLPRIRHRRQRKSLATQAQKNPTASG